MNGAEDLPPLLGLVCATKIYFLNNRTNVWARTFWNISPGCRHARWWLRLCGSLFCVWKSQHIWCVHIFHQFVRVTHINPCPKGLVERFKLGFQCTPLITVYWNKRNRRGRLLPRLGFNYANQTYCNQTTWECKHQSTCQFKHSLTHSPVHNRIQLFETRSRMS